MSPHDSRPRPPQSLPEAVARTVRHEVGDLLQTVYSAVAILRERIPESMGIERRILSDLRQRAEACRDLLDTVHDLVAPLTCEVEELDLADLVATAVSRSAARYPGLLVRYLGPPRLVIHGDERRLAQVANLLLKGACSTAVGEVRCELRPGPTSVGWSVEDDGPGVPADQESQLFSPLTTSPHGHLGPGLAVVRRLVELHGGTVVAGNRGTAGFAVTVALPASPGAL